MDLAEWMSSILVEPQYAERWLSEVLVGKSGQGVLSRPAVARVAFRHEVELSFGATDTTYEAMAKRVSRLLAGESRSESTAMTIADAFRFTDEHRAQLTTILTTSRRAEAEEAALPASNDLLDPTDLDRLRRLRGHTRTIAAAESHRIGPDMLPSTHRTIQVVESRLGRATHYPYIYNSSEASVQCRSGGEVCQLLRISDEISVAVIEFYRPIFKTETAAFELDIQFKYSTPPPPSFRRAVLSGPSSHLDIRVEFSPAAMPNAIYWVELDADQNETSKTRAMPSGSMVSRFVERSTNAIVGFDWVW